MGIQSIFDSRIFTKKTYESAVNKDDGKYRIEIVPQIRKHANENLDISVVGILQQPIKFSMSCDWGTLNLGSVVNNSNILSTALNYLTIPSQVAGISVNNAGLLTKKFYAGQKNYLELNANFKVVNWKDNYEPLKCAIILLNLCVPQRKTGIGDLAKNLIEAGKDVASEIWGDTGAAIYEKLRVVGGKAFNSATNGMIKGTEKVTGENVRPDLNELDFNLPLTIAPPPVAIKIGDYFNNNDMVIDDVSTEFSYEMTSTGPLYVEFNVKFSTREAIVVGKNGFQLPKKRIIEKVNNTFNKSKTGKAFDKMMGQNYPSLKESGINATPGQILRNGGSAINSTGNTSNFA